MQIVGNRQTLGMWGLTAPHITNNQNITAMAKIPGLSFSLKRAVGISGLKTKVARKIGIPTTKQGLERKIGGAILKAVTGKKRR